MSLRYLCNNFNFKITIKLIKLFVHLYTFKVHFKTYIIKNCENSQQPLRDVKNREVDWTGLN